MIVGRLRDGSDPLLVAALLLTVVHEIDNGKRRHTSEMLAIARALGRFIGYAKLVRQPAANPCSIADIRQFTH
jgi:hypothetical protein